MSDNEAVADELADLVYARAQYAKHEWQDERIDLFLERNIVILRSELPAVKRSEHDENVYWVGGENICFTTAENARAWVIRDIAVWQFIEAEEAKDAARDKRRDELATEFTAVNSYSGQLAYTQNLINRIIDLEQAAK